VTLDCGQNTLKKWEV